jgi:hypothetical protein
LGAPPSTACRRARLEIKTTPYRARVIFNQVGNSVLPAHSSALDAQRRRCAVRCSGLLGGEPDATCYHG